MYINKENDIEFALKTYSDIFKIVEIDDEIIIKYTINGKLYLNSEINDYRKGIYEVLKNL